MDNKEEKGAGWCPSHPYFDNLVGDFLQESSLHGVKYLGDRDRHIIERIFWAIAVLSCFGLSIFLVQQVYSKYNASPVIISFQPTETNIARIPFPAITICNVNILKRKELDNAFDYFVKLTSNMTQITDEIQDMAIIMEHITQYCLAAPSFRRRVKLPLYDVGGRPDYVQHITTGFSDFNNTITSMIRNREINRDRNSTHRHFFRQASHNCGDMLLKCLWAREEVPCLEHFLAIDTRHGHCCVINMLPKYLLRKYSKSDSLVEKEKTRLTKEAKRQWEAFDPNQMVRDEDDVDKVKYPKYQMAGGKPFGLSILVNPELSEYSTCSTNDGFGLKIVPHTPISFPDIMQFGMGIPHSSEVFLELRPQVTIADEDVLKPVPVDIRGCLLPDDVDAQLETFNYYTAANCLDECITKYTIVQCGCVRYLQDRNATLVLCGSKQQKCANDAAEYVMTNGKMTECPHCIPACTEIRYKMQMSYFPLQSNATAPFEYNNTLKNYMKDAQNYTILHIFLGTDTLYAKERKTLYGASDLLANAGGLLSLCLGFSVLSLVQMIYYCTLRAWFQFRDIRKKKVVQVADPDFYTGGGSTTSRRRANRKKLDLKKTTMHNYYNWTVRNRFHGSRHQGSKSPKLTRLSALI